MTAKEALETLGCLQLVTDIDTFDSVPLRDHPMMKKYYDIIDEALLICDS